MTAGATQAILLLNAMCRSSPWPATGRNQHCNSSAATASERYPQCAIFSQTTRRIRFGWIRKLRFVNQYSYLLLVIFVLLLSAVAAYFWLPKPAGLALVTLLGVVFVAAASLLRYRETHLPDTAALDGLIGKGSPVLVVLFSHY